LRGLLVPAGAALPAAASRALIPVFRHRASPVEPSASILPFL
jgi:hypothetical protein